MSKRSWIIIGIVIVALIILYNVVAALTFRPYNEMVRLDEGVKTAWAQVENVYQRRSDLIPNLVNTVKGYAEHEKSTLEEVTNARSNATGMKIDPKDLSPENIQKFQKAQDALGASLSRLLVVMEKYPDLKANQNFLEFQTQLESTENRIAVERNKFNDVVKEYNTYIRSFPNNMISGMYGFIKRGYFEAAAGAAKAPEVKF